MGAGLGHCLSSLMKYNRRISREHLKCNLQIYYCFMFRLHVFFYFYKKISFMFRKHSVMGVALTYKCGTQLWVWHSVISVTLIIDHAGIRVYAGIDYRSC